MDYVVHASSIKAGRASELIGTFDDSAAVAAAIIVEEYMKQVVSDLLTAERRRESTLSKRGVQAFAMHLLEGLNWSLFWEQHNCKHDPEKQADAVVRAIEEEIATVEAPPAAQRAEVAEWIRETASQYQTHWKAANERALAVGKQTPRPDDAEVEAPHSMKTRQRKKTADRQEPHLRLGVRQHDVTGLPSYHFTVETVLPGDQLVRVAVDGVDTQEQALRRVDAVKETLRLQHDRLLPAVRGRLPVLKQQLLSAELEQLRTRHRVGKLTAADKRLLAMTNPDVRAKIEHRRVQQRVWRQQMIAKKRQSMETDESRLLPSVALVEDPTRRPIGRPRKVRVVKPVDEVDEPPPVRRPRGRPRKVLVVEATETNESGSAATTGALIPGAEDAAPVRRRRGRPRKQQRSVETTESAMTASGAGNPPPAPQQTGMPLETPTV